MRTGSPLEAVRFGTVQALHLNETLVTGLDRAARHAIWLLLLGVAYALTARLSQQALFLRSQMGLFWVPNALMLAALLLTPKRWWALIFAVGAGAHVLSMNAANPTWRLAWQIAANGIFVVATADVLCRFTSLPLRFDRRRGTFAYMGVVFVMPVLVALTSPGFVRSVMRIETVYSPPIAFVRFVLASLSPMLIVTPAILLCAGIDMEWFKTLTKRRFAEAALILLVAIAVGVLAFDANQLLAELPWLLLLTFLPLVWAAFRLGPTGASLALLCNGALSVAGAMREHGPFVRVDDPVLSLHIYWLLVAPAILLLAAAIREREQAAVRLREEGVRLMLARQTAERRELVGTLAHNVRQPLAAMLANTQAVKLMLSRQPADLCTARGILHDIEEQNRHAAAVVSQLQLSVREEKSAGLSTMAKNVVSHRPSLGESIGEAIGARKPPLIGILDDDRSVRVALARLCRVRGLDTCEFACERELFDSLESARPDCLVLDAQMPTISGVEVHRRLREQHIDIPAILVTGREDDEIRAQAKAAGVYAYLCKPVDGDVLINTIESALRAARTTGT